MEAHYPDAARSLLEGLEEIFTINRPELSPSQRRYLGTINLIECTHSGVRIRTRRVSCWQGGKMVLRWVASTFLAMERNFRRIQGYRNLWMLEAGLREEVGVDSRREVA